MFTNSKTFSSFSTNDLDRARQFYGDVLGLKVQDNPMGIIELHFASGSRLMIYPKPDHMPATFTVLNFLTDNIDMAVDELTQKGVVFEQYDMPEIKTDERGIARGGQGPSIAWFKDPAGNILSVIEERS